MPNVNTKNWRPSEAQRQRMIASRSVNELMRTVIGDRVLLLCIVIEGRHAWRKTFSKAYKGMPVGRDAIDELFNVFSTEAGPNPRDQFEKLMKAGVRKLKTDRIEGLCMFITSEGHMDTVLAKVDNEDERAAIRAVMVPILQRRGVIAPTVN
jgi:hypothetical protein